MAPCRRYWKLKNSEKLKKLCNDWECLVCPSVCVSVCVCLSVREHITGTAGPIGTKFCVQIPCGRGSVLLWRCLRYVMYFRFYGWRHVSRLAVIGHIGIAWLAWAATSCQLSARLGWSLISMNAFFSAVGATPTEPFNQAYSCFSASGCVYFSFNATVACWVTVLCMYTYVYHSVFGTFTGSASSTALLESFAADVWVCHGWTWPASSHRVTACPRHIQRYSLDLCWLLRIPSNLW